MEDHWKERANRRMQAEHAYLPFPALTSLVTYCSVPSFSVSALDAGRLIMIKSTILYLPKQQAPMRAAPQSYSDCQWCSRISGKGLS